MAIALTADRFGHRRLILFGTHRQPDRPASWAALCRRSMCCSGCVSWKDLASFASSLRFRRSSCASSRCATAHRSCRLVDLHAGGRRRDDADRGPRPAGDVVALGVVDRGGGPRASCWLALLLRTVRRHELDPVVAPRRPILAEMAEVATSGGPLAIGVCFGAYSCCWFAVIGFLPTLQVERLHFTPETAAIVTTIVATVNIAGNLAAGWLLQRGVPRVVHHRLRDRVDGDLRVGDLRRRRAGSHAPGSGWRLFGRDRRRAGLPLHRHSGPCPPAAAGRRGDRAADAGVEFRRAGRAADHGALVSAGGWPAASWMTAKCTGDRSAGGRLPALARKA